MSLIRFGRAGRTRMHSREDEARVTRPMRALRPAMAATFRLALVLAAPFALAAVLLGLSLPTNHDEYQYVAAGHLFARARIYAEYFYSQTPFYPAALSAWLWATDGVVPSGYVSARLFTIAWSLIYVVALLHALLRLSPSRLLAVAILAAVFCVDIMRLPLRVARNDMMPLALTAVALAVLVEACLLDTARRRLRAALHLLAGLLIAAAVGTKQSYAIVAVTAVAYALAAPHLPLRDRWRSQVLPMAIGGAAGAIPMLVIVAAAPASFLYAVSEYHATHHLWWAAPTAAEEAVFRSVANRAYVVFRGFANPPLAALGLGFLACMAAVAASGRRALAPDLRPLWSILLLAALTVAVGIPAFLVPAVLHGQYLAPVLPFVAVCAAAGAALSAEVARGRARAGVRRWMHLWAVFAFAGALAYGLFLPGSGPLALLRAMALDNVRDDRAAWMTEHARRVDARLQEVLGPPRRELRIATIMNAYPVSAGFGIHRELASAPFFYQTNDRLPPGQVVALAGTSPRLARDWLRREDVQAVLLGYDPLLEMPFLAHARESGFLCFRVDLRGGQADVVLPAAGQLWVAPALARTRPDCGAGP